MGTYNYVSENGKITSRTTSYNWLSLCHKEDIMDGWNMMEELNSFDGSRNGFGWSVCRKCGKQADFYKNWPENRG